MKGRLKVWSAHASPFLDCGEVPGCAVRRMGCGNRSVNLEGDGRANWAQLFLQVKKITDRATDLVQHGGVIEDKALSADNIQPA
jgi:hypothetical protein